MPAATALRTNSKVIFLNLSESPVGARKFEVTCSSCNLREMCLPQGLEGEDLRRAAHWGCRLAARGQTDWALRSDRQAEPLRRLWHLWTD